jgi:hypothetical protein
MLLTGPQASSADTPVLVWGASMEDAIVAVGQRASLDNRTCRERVPKAAAAGTQSCAELAIERHRLGDHAYRVVFDTSVGHLTEVRLTSSDRAHDAAVAEAAFETIRQALAEATGHSPPVRPLDPWDAALLGADPKGRSRQATWGENERVTLSLVIPADGKASPHVSLRHDPFELKVVQPVLIRGTDSSAIRKHRAAAHDWHRPADEEHRDRHPDPNRPSAGTPVTRPARALRSGENVGAGRNRIPQAG